MIKLDKRSTQMTALLILAFVWGSSFILMKKSLVSFSPLQVAAFRMFLAATFFLPVVSKRLKLLSLKDGFWLFFVGFVGNQIPSVLFTFAQTRINSSLAGMLNALTPIFALLIGLLLFKTKVRWWQVVGVLSGLLGAVGLISGGGTNLFAGNLGHAALVVLAALCYALSAHVIHQKLKHYDGISVAALALFLVSPIAGVYLASSDFSKALASPMFWESVLYMVVLAILGTSLSLIVFNTLVHKTSALFASSVTYIIPIFAMLWGLLDGEVISTIQFVCMFVVLLGVYLVNKH